MSLGGYVLLILTIGRVQSFDCYQHCQGINFPDSCYANCDTLYILVSVLCGFFGIFILICLFCLWKNNKLTCCDCSYRAKKRLKQIYNLEYKTRLSRKDFENEVNDIDAALKHTSLQSFGFQVEGKTYFMRVDNQSVKIKKEKQYEYAISFKGIDEYQQFSAEGYIICRKDAALIWFLKVYQNKDSVIQKGLRHLVTYQLEKHSQKMANYKGRWYINDADQQEKRMTGMCFLLSEKTLNSERVFLSDKNI